MLNQALPLHQARPTERTESPRRLVAFRRPPRFRPGRVAGCGLLTLLIAVALLGPVVYPVDPAAQALSARLAPPLGFGGTLAHPLGTDTLGRDLLARLIAGARLSLGLGVIITTIAAGVGVTIGIVAGYFGGTVDRLMSWLADVQLAIPFVVIAIVLTAKLGNGVATIVVSLALTGWVSYARVVRLQGRALRRAPWVEAARSLGVSNGRLLTRHLFPNLLPTVLVLVSQQVAGVILYESALSYLGLGVGGNSVSWGGMVATGQEAIFKAWWVTVVPGMAVAVTVLALSLIGDEPA